MRCYFNFCRQANTFLVAFFQRRFYIVPIHLLRCHDRKLPAKPSHTERINPFPTAMDFGAGKTDTYCNKVAPTARIYLHLICRKRHLPLKLRKGKTKGGAEQKLNTVLTYGGSFPVSSVTSTPGSRNMRIGSCVKAPLKKRGSHGFLRTPEPGYQRYMYP